jgi:hypothetical protein
MAGALVFPEFRAFDDNGDPLAGGFVYTYEAGSLTPKDTYTTALLNVANTNPVELDAEGYPTSGGIWLSGSYKIIIKDADGVQQGDTIDAYSNDPGATGPAGTFQIVTAGGTVDAITADYSPNVTLANLTTCAFVATGANTTATPTFAPDGLTAHTITKKGGAALVPGDIPAALAVCILEYNSANTRWELLNPATTAMPWVVATGTADALTATYSPAIGTLYDGLILSFRAAAANATTTPTFAPNGLTARTIVKSGGTALAAGDIAGNLAEYWIRYNLANTRWELLNPKVDVAAASDTVAGKIEIAIQSEMETATSTVLAVTPGRQHFHPGSFKAWVFFTSSGGTYTAQSSYGYTSFSKTATGKLEITWSRTMSGVNYGVFGMAGQGASRPCIVSQGAANTATVSTVWVVDTANNFDDPAFLFVGIVGDI